MDRAEARAAWRHDRIRTLTLDLAALDRRRELVGRHPLLLGWLWPQGRLASQRRRLYRELVSALKDRTVEIERLEPAP